MFASLARNLEICLVSRKTSKMQEIAHYSAEGYKITRRRIGDEGGEGRIPEIGTLMTYEDKPRGQLC